MDRDKDTEQATSIVKSAGRVLEIFELFDAVQRPLQLVEISRQLKYPAASALALLKTLQSMDYMSFDSVKKTYSPTIRIAMLGAWIQGQVFLNGAMVGLMNELADETGETIMLGMQNDVHAQYVHTVQSAKALRYFLKPGTLRPIWRSATGYALLSGMPDEQIRKLVKRINVRTGVVADVLLNEKSLLAEVERVRKRGYAYSDQLTEGISAIAILLPHTANGRLMTIGIGGPTSRVKPLVKDFVALVNRKVSTMLPPPGRLESRHRPHPLGVGMESGTLATD